MKAPEKDGVDFEKQLVSEGLVDAKCYAVIDLGSEEFEWNGEKHTTRKIQISFETQQMWTFGDKGELPLTIHITKTFSLYEQSRLYPLIKDWALDEAKANMFNLVGMPAQLMVSHSTTKKGKIFADVLKIKKSTKDFDLVNEEVMFSLDQYQQSEWEKLPEWMQKKIELTPEYATAIEIEKTSLPF